MTELLLIGIGAGNPDHLTFQAARALSRADLILIPLKGAEKADLAGLRERIVATHAPQGRVVQFDLPRRASGGDYLGHVNDWHDAIAAAWDAQIRAHLPRGGTVAVLVWGDPSLYDSSLRIAERLRLPVRVVPGITAIQALCAAHAVPLNDLGAPVAVTTGRRLRDEGWPPGVDRAVVMLDGDCAFRTLPPAGLHIWWGAYLGMAQELLAAGPLAETGPRIVEMRAEARARHGWIMDCYLLAREG